AGLAPAPKTVSVAEPADAGELPAVVLSLEPPAGAGNGLGARGPPGTGALPWQASIDLANPVLADDPTVTLLDSGRKVLTLPHGGLVKKDGSAGPFTADDLTVQVAGAARA